jgi:sugar/nucleoside kinase (ribokinase family)
MRRAQLLAAGLGLRGGVDGQRRRACSSPPMRACTPSRRRSTVKSTVGAGDAMVAGFVAGSCAAGRLADCARLATASALGALTQLGPRLPSPAIIESFMAQVTVRQVADLTGRPPASL